MKKLQQIEVVRRIKELLPSITIISEYKGRFKKMVVSDEFGIIYSVSPDKLFAGKKPSLATAVDKTDGFIKKAKYVHGEKYSYTKSEYIRDNVKVKIICDQHGEFMQLPTNHLKKQGCPKCGIDSMKLNRPENGFSRNQWVKYCINKNKTPKLYIIHCHNSKESFIKVGITTRNVLQKNGSGRYWKTNMPYDHSVLLEVQSTPEWCFEKEKEIETSFNNFKYNPLIYFNGLTECYSFEILNDIKKLIAA